MATSTDEAQPSTDPKLRSLPPVSDSNVDKTEQISGNNQTKNDNEESLKTAREKEASSDSTNTRESWKGGLDFLMNLVAYAGKFYSGIFFVGEG